MKREAVIATIVFLVLGGLLTLGAQKGYDYFTQAEPTTLSAVDLAAIQELQKQFDYNNRRITELGVKMLELQFDLTQPSKEDMSNFNAWAGEIKSLNAQKEAIQLKFNEILKKYAAE